MILVASRASAQESWLPVIVLDGTSISIGGKTSPVENGPVQPVGHTPADWGVPNPAIAYPNGVTENRLTNEWIIADTYHGRLLRFATDHHPARTPGAFLGAIVTSVKGETSLPYSPVVDDDGVILVPDRYDDSIKAFVPADSGAGLSYAAHRIARFTNGSADDRFHEPIRLALLPDASGHVRVEHGVGAMLVLDSASARVLKLNFTGSVANPQWTAAFSFGEDASVAGAGLGRFYYPSGLAVDAAGNIYVSDPNNTDSTSVHVFAPDGTPLKRVSGLSTPWGAAVDHAGRLFVAETGNNRIAIFDPYDRDNPAGSLTPVLARIGTASLPLGGLSLPDGVNPAGPAGELQEPTALAFDQFGRLLVADTDNFRLQIFEKSAFNVAAVATPSIVAAADSFVDVAVTVSAPRGGTRTVGNVVPSIPSARFGGDSRSAVPVVTTSPECVITPTSGGACLGLGALQGATLPSGGRLEYVFRFRKAGGSPAPVGPVWFSVEVTGALPSNAPGVLQRLVSATAPTNVVAVGGDGASRPVLDEPRLSSDPQDPAADTSANGWFRTQPVYVHLNASVPNPGEGGDGYVQEIQYHFGPTPPAEGDHHTCFNLFDLDPAQSSTMAAACSVPVFKEGATKLWFRALSTRGLYDRMVTHGSIASLGAWSSVDVRLDTWAPYYLFSYDQGGTPGKYGWFNKLPVNLGMRLVDVGSQLATASLSGRGIEWSLGTSDVPFAPYGLSFTTPGIHDFSIAATDRAGNTRRVAESVKIDTVAPAVTYSSVPSGAAGAGGVHWYGILPGSVTFTAIGDDGAEGIGFSSGRTSKQTFGVSRPGNKVTATFTDLLGNTATASASFNFDPIPPIVLPPTPRAPDALVGSTRWYRSPISVTFNASDGIGAGFVDPDTRQFTPTLVRVATSQDGGIVGETFTDLVGNSTFRAAGPFNFDQAGPAVSAAVRDLNDAPSAGVPGGGVTWFRQPVKVTFTATDAGVGFSATTPTLTTTETVMLTAGRQTVTRTIADRLGNATTATIGPLAVDTVAPQLSIPEDISVPARGMATAVAFTASASDALDPSPVVACDPASGHPFPLGSSRVNCSARDAAGNQTTASFTVTVTRTPPTLTVPVHQTTEATNPTGAIVAFTAAATDVIDATIPVVCAPASGSMFPLGTTTVTCSAANSAKLTSTQTFAVDVVDTAPPVLSQASVNLVAAGPSGARAAYGPLVSDLVSGSALPVACTPPSGSMFPIGSTDVTCRATDGAGNGGQVTFKVIVAHTAPVCSAAAASLGSIWPPNHKLETVGIKGVTNADGSEVTIRVASIFQDEPTAGLGGGDVPVDGFGVGGSAALVRAERGSGGNGRVYYIGFTAASPGGSCSGTVRTSVPHDRGKGQSVGGGQLYDSTK
jgi:hypothetical protein